MSLTRLAGRGLVLIPLIPPDLLAALLLIEASHFHAGAEATVAPAVLGGEREQARIQLGEALATRGAGALGREHDDLVALRSEHVDESFAEIQGARQCL